VLQLAFGGRQAATDLAQRLGSPELAKQHRHKLIPAAEPARMPLGLMLLNQSFKLQSRKQLQQLRKNAAYSIQAETSTFSDWLFPGTQSNVSVFRPYLIWTGVVANLPPIDNQIVNRPLVLERSSSSRLSRAFFSKLLGKIWRMIPLATHSSPGICSSASNSRSSKNAT